MLNKINSKHNKAPLFVFNQFNKLANCGFKNPQLYTTCHHFLQTNISYPKCLFHHSKQSLSILQRYVSVYCIVIFIKNDQIQLIQPIFAIIVCEVDVQSSNIACKFGNFCQRLFHSTIFAVIWLTASSSIKIIAVCCRIFNNDYILSSTKFVINNDKKNFCAPPMMVENHHRNFNYLKYHS